MDKRTLLSKKAKPRNARQYDLRNQGLFGKVCNTVRGFFSPTTWLINSVTQLIGNSEEQPGASTDIEGTLREDNDIVSQSVSHGNKRLRLRFDDDIPSIQSSGTQTWPDQPPQNLYDTVSHVQSSTTESSLLENKESIGVLNGDDHSENSEGSASTSGCSSLVSSHKDSNRVVESPFHSLGSGLKNSRKRKEPSSSKSGLGDLNSSRSLWSTSFSPSSKFQRRLPTISHTNQPSFNLSTFVGPSKLNESMEKKISSPFYEGKTTFGGASASRRMPPSVAPYQVNKTLRNQIKVREHNSHDNLEGMSSAAKRILLTLEKMSTPVADAKKIPNIKTSPVDLSVYLAPPKCRRNSQFTPSVSSKGPPIANINTIAKLATLKNYGVSRLRNTLPSSPVTSVGQESFSFENQQSSISEPVPQKSGGGKIRNKLNQHHHSSKDANGENEVLNDPVLPNIPLPITKLPTINFGTKTEKPKDSNLPCKGFTFSSPIEHDLAISNAVPASSFALPSSYDSKIEKHSDLQPKSFVFSNPIEHELPNNNVLPKENTSLPSSYDSKIEKHSDLQLKSFVFSSPVEHDLSNNNVLPKENTPLPMATATTVGSSVSTWECDACWVRNAFGRTSCVACETPRVTKENTPLPVTTATTVSSSVSTWECDACWVRNTFSRTSCAACETPRVTKENHSKNKSTGSEDFSTWECTSCWVRNPMKEKKCMACETLHPNADKKSGLKDTNGFKFSSPIQNSPITFKFGNYVCTAPTTSSSNKDKSSEDKSVQPETKDTNANTENTSSVLFHLTNQSQPAASTFKVLSNAPVFNFGDKTDSNKINLSNTSVSVTTATTTSFCSTSNPSNFGSVTDSKTSEISSAVSETLPPPATTEDAKIPSTVSFSSTPTTSSFVFGSTVTTSAPSASSTPVSAAFTFGASSNATQLLSKPDGLKDTNGFKFSSPAQNSSITFKFGDYVSTAPPASSSNKDKSSDDKSVQPETKDTNTNTENKSSGLFHLTNQSQPVPSTFKVLSNAPVFKFGEKTDSSKINLSNTSVALTTATATSFCFGGNPSNFGSVSDSKASEISSAVSETLPPPAKTEDAKIPSTVSFTPTTNSFVFGSTVTTSAPSAFSFFPSSSASSTPVSAVFTFGASSNTAQVSKPGGFTFKGLEKPQTAPSISSISQSATPVLNIGTSAPVPSGGGFIFGNPKTEAQNVASAPFAFGSGAPSSSNASAFSAFQPTQPANPAFQFGSQPSGSTALGSSNNFAFSKSEVSNQVPSSVSQNPGSAFGSSSNYVFGNKNETANQIPSTVSQAPGIVFGSSTSSFSFSNKTENTNTVSQNPNPTFGSSTMPSVFGNASIPSFGGTDKPATGGFNFGAVSTPGVFQFGASNNNNTERKRTATASGFTFGTPTASEPNTSFTAGFNMNTPPSFNFGSTSTPAAGPGPFQFAASSAPKSATAQNAPRKYRKALRRVRKD